ncbi:putative exodeoxyribonuclease I [Arabidopsis thaliana]
MCILCDCDYFKWPLTEGSERAYELIGTKTIRGREVIEELLEDSTDLTSHLKKFIILLLFKYQYVYNQVIEELQHLNVPEVSNLPFLRDSESGDEFVIRKYEDSTGTYLSTTKTKEIAEGRLNPETHEKFTHVEVEETDDEETT